MKKNQNAKRGILTKRIALIVIVLISIAGVSGSTFFYLKWQDQKNNTPEHQTSILTSKVAKLIALPNETPTVATIEDKAKLKGQPFFNDANNGDKILIFTAAKKAIIYREADNKLINVGPISLTSDVAAEDKAKK